ncbi:MAG: GFA family protein [Desulfobacterales bacterium]
MMRSDVRATGGCLCGAVRYEVVGELMPVINCHCSKCRRFHGHVGAYTATYRQHLVLVETSGLQWYRSVQDETPAVYRGFCRTCGSSLFWDPREKPTISIAAGSIDPPTRLATERHVWLSQKADYYSLTDGLPCHDQGFGRADSSKP